MSELTSHGREANQEPKPLPMEWGVAHLALDPVLLAQWLRRQADPAYDPIARSDDDYTVSTTIEGAPMLVQHHTLPNGTNVRLEVARITAANLASFTKEDRETPWGIPVSGYLQPDGTIITQSFPLMLSITWMRPEADEVPFRALFGVGQAVAVLETTDQSTEEDEEVGVLYRGDSVIALIPDDPGFLANMQIEYQTA